MLSKPDSYTHAKKRREEMGGEKRAGRKKDNGNGSPSDPLTQFKLKETTNKAAWQQNVPKQRIICPTAHPRVHAMRHVFDYNKRGTVFAKRPSGI